MLEAFSAIFLPAVVERSVKDLEADSSSSTPGTPRSRPRSTSRRLDRGSLTASWKPSSLYVTGFGTARPADEAAVAATRGRVMGRAVDHSPSLGSSWVLIRNGKAPHRTRPAIAKDASPAAFLRPMVAETNSTTGQHEWRKRSKYEHPIHDHDIVYVFPCKPSPSWVAEARRGSRRQQQT